MSLSAKTLLSFLVGAAASALVWRLLLHGSSVTPLNQEPPPALFAALFGVTLGLGLGAVGAWAADARIERGLSLALGGACGLAGAVLGSSLSGPITNAIAHNAHGLSEAANLALLTVGQASGWGVLGLVLGGGLGGARRTARLAWQGAIGGLVGGLLGGIALVSLPQADIAAFGGLPLSPLDLERQATGYGALGGMIGLGIALVPRLARANWVRVQEGGREHILARLLMTIGQDRECDIVLRGDMRVAPVHATIEAMPGGRHHLTVAAVGGGRFAPVAINERAVIGEQWLADGDCLQIGMHALVFHERATRGALQLGPAQPEAWTQARDKRERPAAQAAFAPASEPPAVPPPPAVPNTGTSAAPPAREVPSLILEPMSMLGLSRDAAMLSLGEDAQAKDGAVPLSALPALLSGIVLRAEQGPYVGRAFVVEASGVTQLGRAIEREIPLPMDRTVSRLHARIVPDGDGYVLEDAGSANGTLVNGLRVTGRRALHAGDVIQIGATVLRYT